MTRYQTEIVVPADRYVALQLPPDLPEGRATVTVVVHSATDFPGSVQDEDDESQDIEWWEEFEDDYERVV
ncbi:MAG: hypothetical protein P4L84_13440 [Isosphaeraceae bacterium]|nr:hypothetical protein [Isosphaeraceae bacterium]